MEPCQRTSHDACSGGLPSILFRNICLLSGKYLFLPLKPPAKTPTLPPRTGEDGGMASALVRWRREAQLTAPQRVVWRGPRLWPTCSKLDQPTFQLSYWEVSRKRHVQSRNDKTH